MDLLLENRAFFVTGGSKGIGKDIVLSLLNEGAFVATCARNDEPLLKMQKVLPIETQKRLIFAQCDICNKNAVNEFIEYILLKFKRLDGVVTNAGYGTNGTVLGTPHDEWFSQYEMKLVSILNTITPAIPELKKSNSGRIVIINGITANTPDCNMAAVSAARAGVRQVAYMLAHDLAPDILVNTINLGAIDTNRQKVRYSTSQSNKPYSEWEKDEAVRRGILLNRFGKPHEVTPFVKLFLSPLSSYITAASIDISGGLNVK